MVSVIDGHLLLLLGSGLVLRCCLCRQPLRLGGIALGLLVGFELLLLGPVAECGVAGKVAEQDFPRCLAVVPDEAQSQEEAAECVLSLIAGSFFAPGLRNI